MEAGAIMVTYEQAISESRFHYSPRCELLADVNKMDSPHPKSRPTIERWRRNGATKVWKTRPGEFSIPVKYGLRSYAYITHNNASEFHLASGCEYD